MCIIFNVVVLRGVAAVFGVFFPIIDFVQILYSNKTYKYHMKNDINT